MESHLVGHDMRDEFRKWLTDGNVKTYSTESILSCMDKFSEYAVHMKITDDSLWKYTDHDAFEAVYSKLIAVKRLLITDWNRRKVFIVAGKLYLNFLEERLFARKAADSAVIEKKEVETLMGWNPGKTITKAVASIIEKKEVETAIADKSSSQSVIDREIVIAWLVTQPNAKGTLYLESVVRQYMYSLCSAPLKLRLPIAPESRNVFACRNADELIELWETFKKAPNYNEVNSSSSGMFSAGMGCLLRYLYHLWEVTVTLEKKDEPDVIQLIESLGLKYVDKRRIDGALWVIGGRELTNSMMTLSSAGFHFLFKEGGGRSSAYRDAWWYKPTNGTNQSKPEEQQAAHLTRAEASASHIATLRVDFVRSECCAHTQPLTCTINGKSVIPSKYSWPQLLVAITERFIEEGNPNLASLDRKPLYGTEMFFLPTKLDYTTCALLSNGKWICINYNPQSIVKIIQYLCRHCGVSLDDVVITYESNNGTSDQSTQSYSRPAYVEPAPSLKSEPDPVVVDQLKEVETAIADKSSSQSIVDHAVTEPHLMRVGGMESKLAGHGMREEFRKWLTDNNEKTYSPQSILSCMDKFSEYAVQKEITKGSLWKYTDHDAFKLVYSKLIEVKWNLITDWIRRKVFIVAGKLYLNFLEERLVARKAADSAVIEKKEVETAIADKSSSQSIVDREAFVAWLIKLPNANGRLYSESVVRQYIYSLSSAPLKLRLPIAPECRNVFACRNADELVELWETFKKAPNYNEVNFSTSVMFSAGMRHLLRYLQYQSGAVPTSVKTNQSVEPQARYPSQPVHAASVSSTQRVDFSRPELCDQTRPLTCAINGQAVVPSKQYWPHLLVAITERFIEEGNHNLASLARKPLYGSKMFFLPTKSDNKTCALLSNGKWICINYNPQSIVKIIQYLCRHCGVSLDDVVITYESNNGSSVQSMQSYSRPGYVEPAPSLKSAPDPAVVDKVKEMESAIADKSSPQSIIDRKTVITWLVTQPNANGRMYSESAVRQYMCSLSSAPLKLRLPIVPERRNVFACRNADELVELWETFKKAPNYKAVNISTSGRFSVGMGCLLRYLQHASGAIPTGGKTNQSVEPQAIYPTPPVHAASASLAQRVDFSRPELCAQTRPLTCTINGKAVIPSKNYWSQLLIAITERFIEEGNPNLASLDRMPLYGSKMFFLRNKASLGTCSLLSNGRWIYTTYNPQILVTIIKNLCRHCGVDLDDVVITYVPNNGPPAQSTQSCSHSSYIRIGTDGANVAAVAPPKPVLDPAVVELLTRVLSSHFANGYRLNSTIELTRFRTKAAEDLCEESTLSDEELKRYISACGTVFDGKVYAVSAEAKERIKELAENYFAKGAYVIFFSEFYARNENWLFAASVVSEDMLTGILRELFPKLSFTQTYFGYTGDSVFAVLENEILRVWGDDVLLTYEQLAERLQYIPIERIKSALAQNGNFIWSREKTYSHVSQIDISDEEREIIRDAVGKECDARGYVSITELPFGEIKERNYELSDTAIYNAVFRIYLSDKFDKKDKIVTRKGGTQDALIIMKDYCRTIEKCSLDDLLDYEKELTGEGDRCIAMEAGNTVLVLIDKETYVADKFVRFDVESVDAAIELFIAGDYVPLKSFTTFAAFPDCGQTWNLFLLESYCRRFSEIFRFDAPSVNSRNVGAVIRKHCGLSYTEIMIDAVANADVPLTNSAVGKFLLDAGYIGRTRNNFNEIIDKAKVLRERRD